MPRQPRLDAPGLLHHVMARGIERRPIFHGKPDYEDFLGRVESALLKSPNQILAWALMPNHFHLLVRSGKGGLPGFMRRLMSGYAVAFNARHRRVGYLFQNRYKSLVVDESSYLLELVRYVHLNPLRAGLVKDLPALARFPYSGHAALLGHIPRPWQSVREVLGFFSDDEGAAKNRYEAFISDAKDLDQKPDLLGGPRRGGEPAIDSRVLGGPAFTDHVLRSKDNPAEKRKKILRQGIGLADIARHAAKEWGLEEKDLYQRDRREPVSRAKSLLIYAGVEILGKTTKEMAALTRMSLPAASKSRGRGAALWGESSINRLIS